ncbi:MAG: SGNH/GDSL hydrolase family protein [Candidatus Omnitrophica bacterium]|nr:SGNH/GDSL hydrolase family protein [Candidatus Omnitrophota bacterium]
MNRRMVYFMAVLCVFSLCRSSSFSAEAPASSISEPFFDVRGGVDNCRIKFMQQKTGRIAYLGGSITTMKGWRELTYDLFKKRFPETNFEFIDAGIGGTNSTLGAFRFEEDAFKNGPVDLLFLEFAVNDGGGDSPDNRRMRAMEGIVRRARRLNPKIDVIMQYFIHQGQIQEINQGKTPAAILDHDKVAKHYNIPIINLSQEMTRRLNAGEFTWDQFSRDSCHPSPFGHEQYLQCIEAFLDAAWKKPIAPDEEMQTYPTPAPLDSMNYENGRFVNVRQTLSIQGWKLVEGWKAEKTCNYGGPVDVYTAEQPGDELKLVFEGSLIGIYAIAGFDAGILEYSIDHGEAQTLDLFDYYCTQFHRPVCRILAENLTAGRHEITIRMKKDKNEKSTGHACRILKWAVN